MTDPPAPPAASRRSRLTAYGLIGGMLAVLALVAMAATVEVTSRPQFCGSCHVMKPYYESWRGSTHRNIACVECHISPGMTAEVRKKYEAISMVARYFTGTYGTNPWAEIDDAACLRCHERRLLAGRALFKGVLFDHAAHLSGMRRGKTLRCTSCHSQIVQGSHIAVTASTCILCHFKGQASNQGTARCTLCHRVPDKVVERGAVSFSHRDVERYGIDCTRCHARPAGSDGAVPRERCITCHNQVERLEHYADTSLLHQKHVSEHKIDCTNCHLEIQHVGRPHAVETAAANGCVGCHAPGHSPQQAFYSGSGGRGVEPMPDPMFLAGVRCEGCHLEIPGHAQPTRRASAVGCMSCHGPGFNRVYETWLRELEERTGGLRRQIDATTAGVQRGSTATLADARYNLDLVVRARGVHNFGYAAALLRRAHDDLNAARQASGLEALPRPWREPASPSPCLACHVAIGDQRGRLFGREFAHAPHLFAAGLGCEACHRPHAERQIGEVVRFGPEGCDTCHHKELRAGQDCRACHSGVFQRTVPSPRGPFEHALHVEGAGLACPECHAVDPAGVAHLKTEACAACHEGPPPG